MTTAATDTSQLEARLAKLEEELQAKRQELVALKRELGKVPVRDCALLGPGGEEINLSALFGDKQDLILIHNMGSRCPYCTLWADNYNGVRHHIESRAAFAVVSPDDPETQQKFAESRGWAFRMLSSMGSDFTKEMGFEKDGQVWPGYSVFRKQADGGIERVSKDFFGPGDDYCSVWHFFDLLEGGAGDWEPRFKYE